MSFDNWNNKDLLDTKHLEAGITHLTIKPKQVKNNTHYATNNTIPRTLFYSIILEIAEYKHLIPANNKEFILGFIKSIFNNSSITCKQMKVLRSIQKQVCPNYLKKPKYWK